MRPIHIASICLGTLAITSWPNFGCSNTNNCYDLGSCEPSTGASSDGGSGGDGNNAGGMSTSSSSSGSGGEMATTANSGGMGGIACPTGYECVAEGMSDHFVRLPSGGNCGGAWSIENLYAPPSDPGCNPCTCSAPEGFCSMTLNIFADANCESNEDIYTAIASGCFPLPSEVNPVSPTTINGFSTSEPMAQLGSCTPGGGGPAQLNTTTACGTAENTEMSCGPNMVCVPAGNGELCNVVDETQRCATGYQEMRGTVATIQNDTRECTCGCDSPPDATCTNSFVIAHTDDSCTTVPNEITPNDCIDISNPSNMSSTNGSVSLYPGAWHADPCMPTDQFNGSVTFGPNEKLCCLAAN